MVYSCILLKSTWVLLKSVINRHGLFLYFIKIDLGLLKSVINRHGLFLYFINIDLGFNKIGQKIATNRTKIAKNQHADFWRFLLVLCVTFALAQVTNKLIKKNLSLVTSYSIFIITPFFLVARCVTIEGVDCI